LITKRNPAREKFNIPTVRRTTDCSIEGTHQLVAQAMALQAWMMFDDPLHHFKSKRVYDTLLTKAASVTR
jgi:hypothetical protein